MSPLKLSQVVQTVAEQALQLLEHAVQLPALSLYVVAQVVQVVEELQAVHPSEQAWQSE